MAKINYFINVGRHPKEYEEAMPIELKSLGLDISIKRVPLDNIDKDAKVIVLHGEGAYDSFRGRRENPTYKLDGKKVIIHVWDLPTHHFENDTQARGAYNATLQSFKPYLVTCASESTQLELERQGIKSEIQLSYFNDKVIGNKPSEKINQIISVGRTIPEKNHITVLYAMSILPQDWTYLVVTPISGLNGAITEVAKYFNIRLEIKENIPTPQVMEEIKKSRLLVAPSTFEGFGLAPKEAVWSGTPAIISDIPPFREFHGETLPIVNPFDFIELSRRISEVWKNGFDLTEAKKKIASLTVNKQAKKFINYLERHQLFYRHS